MSTRKLSVRRGSVTASDPWGTHSKLNLNPNRSSSSTLTIVRVFPPSQPQHQESPPSPIQRRYSGHRRHQSTGASNADAAPRLSFAFSSFGNQASGGPATSHPRPASPTSPHIRPSSPIQRPSSYTKHRLMPDQLLELARQSTDPSILSHNDSHSNSHSPVLRPRSCSLHSHQAIPVTAPATFTPLPPSIYLPFIDRPSEVASLISSPPSAKLFSLLAQTFPPNITTADPDFSIDPATWSYTQLTTWLTTIDREVAPDALWVLNARKCILSRSELIWERVKGALGVPPELDLDEFPTGASDIFDGESDTSSDVGLAERLGRGAGGDTSAVGTWYDWDVVENSPVAEDSFPVRSIPSFNVNNGYLSPQSGLTIAPLVSHPLPNQHSTSTITSLPPLSLPSALAQDSGLQEISEDAEEDEASVSDINTHPTTINQGDFQPQIQGLRISTSLLPTSPLHSPTTYVPPAFSDLPFAHPDTSSSALSSRSGSFSSLAGFAGRRSSSFGSRSGLAFGERRAEKRVSSGRGVGNILFPGSFAQLGGG